MSADTSRGARIARIDTFPVGHELPPGQRYGSARGRVSARVATLVRLETVDGTIGWGEAFGPPAAVTALVAEVAEAAEGQPVSRVVPLVRRLLLAGYHRGHGGLHVCAISGVEIAMWDAWGHQVGVSVAELLGGRARETVDAYASTGYVTDRQDNDDAYTRMLDDAVAEGFTAAKVKLGLGRDRDRRRAEIARERLGNGALMVDFNGNYTADIARNVLDALGDLDLHWVEEPVPPDDLAGMARIRQAGVPVAAGEATYTRFGFRSLIAEQLLDVAQPDLIKCGGLAEARTIADLAHTWNLRVSPHVWGGAVGQAASLQLLAAIPDSPHTETAGAPLWLELDRAPNHLRDRLLTEPIVAKAGQVTIPSGPGLGVEVSQDAVDEFTIGGLRG